LPSAILLALAKLVPFITKPKSNLHTAERGSHCMNIGWW